MDDSPYLQVIRPSRRQVLQGDVFALHLLGGPFVYGRVISIAAKWSLVNAPPAILYYVYRAQSSALGVPDRGDLRPQNLLLPPGFINRLGWSHGYFVTVANFPLESDDLLPMHVFKNNRGGVFNEYGEAVAKPIGPVGEQGLSSYNYLGYEVRRALGLAVEESPG